jgi:hypothetical protein
MYNVFQTVVKNVNNNSELCREMIQLQDFSAVQPGVTTRKSRICHYFLLIPKLCHRARSFHVN